MQKIDIDGLPRCSQDQTRGFFLVNATVKSQEYIMKYIPERLEAVDGLETIVNNINGLNELAEKLIFTYPEKKRRAMLNQMGHMYIALQTYGDPCAVKGATYIECDVLDTLINGCHNECLMCAHPERCNTCKIGKAFDRCCPNDRKKGESWADINLQI